MRHNRVLILDGGQDADSNILCCQGCERAKGRHFMDAHPEMDTAAHGAQCDYCGTVEAGYRLDDPMRLPRVVS